MFGLFKKTAEDAGDVGPNGYYEGEILSGDYAAGDSEYHDMWAHGSGKLTITLDDESVEVYEGSWDVGRFHGRGKLTSTARTGTVETTEGIWNCGIFVSGDE